MHLDAGTLMLSLFTIAETEISNSSWVNFQPAGFQLGGLQNIVGTLCTADVTVTAEPGLVDFGVIDKASAGFSPSSRAKPFTLALEKNCSGAINVAATRLTANQGGCTKYCLAPRAI